MKKLVLAFIHSLPEFFNVGIFFIFILFLFSTLGVSQFNGILYNRCRYTSKPFPNGTWPFNPTLTRVCSKTGLGDFSCPKD